MPFHLCEGAVDEGLFSHGNSFPQEVETPGWVRKSLSCKEGCNNVQAYNLHYNLVQMYPLFLLRGQLWEDTNHHHFWHQDHSKQGKRVFYLVAEVF